MIYCKQCQLWHGNSRVNCVTLELRHHNRAPIPPTPGYHKLGPAAQQAARSRAKAFYPYD